MRYEPDVLSDSHSGLGIGIIDHDSTFLIYFGTTGRHSTQAINSTTLFPVGGVTHLVLDHALINDFKNKHKHPGDSISTYENNLGCLGKLTIRDLMKHSSGLPVILPGMAHLRTDAQQPYKDLYRDSILKYLNQWCHTHQSAKHDYQHSQYNYFLLSLLYSQAPDAILQPFHSSDSKACFAIPAGEQKYVPKQYDITGLENEQIEWGGFLYTMGLNANIPFLLRLARASLQSDDSLLYKISDTNRKNEKYSSDAGFRIIKKRKHWIYMMTGNSRISSCVILLCPETKTAVVVASNSGYSVHLFAMEILRMINFDWKRKI